MQHNAHVNAWIDALLASIYAALNVDNIQGVADWYACGDELI